jgi:hypothetical protein
MNKANGVVGFLAVTAVACMLPALAANPSGSAPAAKKESAVTLQPIPGSPAKRVILTAKAAERLGIETARIGEQAIVHKQVVGGLIVPAMDNQPGPTAPRGFGGFAQAVPGPGSPASHAAAPASGFGGFKPQPRAEQTKLASTAITGIGPTAKDTPPVTAPAPTSREPWVLVMLSQSEWDRLAKDKPARIVPLGTRGQPASEIVAKLSSSEPQEDSKRSMLKAYYVVVGKDHGLELNKRMRVELELTGSGDEHKVVPYSALYYDPTGTAWVYVNTAPLTYERQRVRVERIVRDMAILADGPATGTAVVSTGAPLLYGAEVFGK